MSQSTKPLLTGEQASKLADEVIYERVFSCIDLDALYELEHEINSALFECGLETDAVLSVTDAMIARAFARVPTDQRRWLDSSPLSAVDDDCAACQMIAAEQARQDREDRTARAERAANRTPKTS